MAEFRILSLDGGGTWALIQVKTLIKLYGSKICGHDLLRKFDLVVANSGGALVLGGLVKDLSLQEILAYFTEANQRKIFVGLSISWITILRWFRFGPQYKTESKLSGLEDILGCVGKKCVTELPTLIGRNARGRLVHVVICAFDYDIKRGIFFRSDEESLAASFSPHVKISLAMAIHCSSNAPVNYFIGPALGPEGQRYWDGAIGGFNNPVLAGVTEVIANLDRYETDRQSIKVLSIGTGNVALPRPQKGVREKSDLVAKKEDWSLSGDLNKLAKSIIDDPPDAASFHAHLMLGCGLPRPGDVLPAKSNIVRLNPLVQPVRHPDKKPWQPPGEMPLRAFKKIRDLDMIALAKRDIDRIDDFCQRWMRDEIPNQPIRANSQSFQPEIGHGRFSQATAAWKELAAD